MLDGSTDQNYGRNLIADALGPGAAYSKFNPNPTRNTKPHDDAEAKTSTLHQARTEIIDPSSQAPRGSEPPPKDTHDEKTAVSPARSRRGE